MLAYSVTWLVAGFLLTLIAVGRFAVSNNLWIDPFGDGGSMGMSRLQRELAHFHWKAYFTVCVAISLICVFLVVRAEVGSATDRRYVVSSTQVTIRIDQQTSAPILTPVLEHAPSPSPLPPLPWLFLSSICALIAYLKMNDYSKPHTEILPGEEASIGDPMPEIDIAR